MTSDENEAAIFLGAGDQRAGEASTFAFGNGGRGALLVDCPGAENETNGVGLALKQLRGKLLSNAVGVVEGGL